MRNELTYVYENTILFGGKQIQQKNALKKGLPNKSDIKCE